MRHLVLSFLVFSVNSFPQDLHGRFADDTELAFNSADTDSSLFTDTLPIDGSSDELFGPSLEMADGLPPIDTQGSVPFDTTDSTGTSLNPPSAGFNIAEWPYPPYETDDYNDCGEGHGFACCPMGKVTECVWYNMNDAHCYYSDDLMCCKDIHDHNGIDCSPAVAKSQSLVPGWINDVLRLEVPTNWLVPLGEGNGL